VLVGSWKRCLICRVKFVSCSICERRYKYCSKACSSAARHRTHRYSNRKYSKTRRARLLQSRRQARYRMTSSRIDTNKKVTEQSSKPTPPSIKPSRAPIGKSPKNSATNLSLSLRGVHHQGSPVSHCRFCGRGPLWLPAFSEGQQYKDDS
jgi:hypothetical protein